MASRLQDVILRGLSAAKPLATTVAPGTLYYSTDLAATERSNGTVWETYADTGGAPTPHAPTHSAGGSDPITVTALSGYPGVLTSFLRGDGTFATPSGVAPIPHAATHASGGSDPIPVTALSGYPGGITTFLRADGTFAAPPAGASIAQMGFTVDGGATVITIGTKGFLPIPYACTITKVTLLSTDDAVTAGTITIDIWKDVYANYPPTAADTIINTGAGGVKPNLSGPGVKYQTSTLTGWTTAIAAGDILAFHVDAATLLTRVTLILQVSLP